MKILAILLLLPTFAFGQTREVLYRGDSIVQEVHFDGPYSYLYYGDGLNSYWLDDYGIRYHFDSRGNLIHKQETIGDTTYYCSLDSLGNWAEDWRKVMYYDTPTLVHELDIDVSVTGGSINILGCDRGYVVRVYDLSGRLVYMSEGYVNYGMFLGKQVYLVEVSGEDKRSVFKVYVD